MCGITQMCQQIVVSLVSVMIHHDQSSDNSQHARSVYSIQSITSPTGDFIDVTYNVSTAKECLMACRFTDGCLYYTFDNTTDPNYCGFFSTCSLNEFKPECLSGELNKTIFIHSHHSSLVKLIVSLANLNLP